MLIGILRHLRGNRFIRAVFALLACTALFLLFDRTAFAQTVAAAPAGVDISPWLQLILGVAGIVGPSAIVLIAGWLKTHFKLQADSAAAQTIDLGVTALTQLAVSEISKAPATIPALQVKNTAIRNAITQLSTGTLAAMKLRGVTEETIAQRIDGALSLALTPSVALVPPVKAA